MKEILKLKGGKEHLEKMAKKARTGFETFVLWLFSKRDMHGYELIRILSEEDGFDRAITAAMIYPLLNDMGRRGLLKHKTIPTGKRVKKVYSITPKGIKNLDEAKKRFRQNNLMGNFLREMLK
ncbi:PadR family transcriptional regulator [Candidatus Micrarchaeota archaeon]|nr:PadR family transcriptional regulator [Candidatus Micrarchaeota archaeon]